METLKQLVNALKPSEKRLIRKFYDIQPNGEDKKRLKLFELVASNRAETNEAASKILYGVQPNSAFSHIKSRLKKDILDFLLMQDASKHFSNKISQIEMNVAKWTLQGELLLSRGIYDEADKLLNKALDVAKDFEIFSEVLKIKNLLRTSVGYRKGIKSFKFYNNDMDYYIREYRKLLKVREYNFMLRLPNQFFTNKESEYFEYNTKALKNLEEMHDDGSSVTFTFQYYYLKVDHDMKNRDFEEALEFAKKLLNIVENEKIYKSSRVNVAGVNMVMAGVNLRLGNYEDAIRYAKKGVEKFHNGLMNELRAMESLFFAYLRNGDYQEARELALRAHNHKQIKRNNLVKAKWAFYEANLEYLEGNVDRAASLVRQNNALLKDRSGWLFGFKILELMITADDNEYDRLDYQLSSLSHLFSRNKTEKNSRVRVIRQVLRALISNGGNYTKTNESARDKLGLLENGEGDFYWNPEGYEIIRFDEWFKNKINQKTRTYSKY
ncbi:MAG: tetratricopeptide repeat protein [Bacteroidota bacterium]